jgi:hypothetical protein
MSPRAKAHKAQLKLVTKFGAGNVSRMARMDSDVVRSDRLGSLRPEANSADCDAVRFLIGKNKDGFWVAREENGCAGGIFFTEHGARQFAKRWATPLGCTTKRISEPLELDFKGGGNIFIPLIARFKGAYRVPAPLRDVMSVVLGLAALATAVWLTINLLTLGR